MYTYVIDLQLQYAEFGGYFVCFLRQGLTIIVLSVLECTMWAWLASNSRRSTCPLCCECYN